MGSFGESDRWRAAMFESGNRVRFERPVDEAGRQWWIEAFHHPYGLTPESMGDLITRSVASEKTMVYRTIDGIGHSFSLSVEGRFNEGGSVWLVERSLHLDGSVFSADRMFIPDRDAQTGRGRLLMSDLMEASKLLGIARISIEAERIGRYAWIRMGFVPDRGSWRNIQLDAIRFIQRHDRYLGPEAGPMIAMVTAGQPTTARWLAAIMRPVPSREIFDTHGEPVMVPFGKAFFIEAAPNWTGEFNFDPESVGLADKYVGGHTDVVEHGVVPACLARRIAVEAAQIGVEPVSAAAIARRLERAITERSGGAAPNQSLASFLVRETVIISPTLSPPNKRLVLICSSVIPMSFKRL